MAGRRAPDKLSQGLQDTLPKEGNVDSIPRNNSGLSAPVDLTTLTTMINAHLKNHQARSTEECQALMGSVEANLEGLMDKHFSVNAEPSRVSEMLLFHIMFSGQQYLECEYAHLVFGEGETRSVSYPIWKLCALLPLPRFAGLQDRLVAHVLLLASHWLPRDTAVLIGFFEDVVELLQNLEELWRIAEERGEDAVFVAGTRVVAFPRLGEGLVRGPLDIELPSRHNLFLCRASLTTIASKLGTLTPGTFTGTYAYAALWCTLGRQLNVALRPDTEALHKVSLEALVTLLDEVPPGGCMPRLGIDCLRLAGRVLVVRAERGEVDEEDERSVKHATLRGKLERVATIQDLLAKCLRLMFRESHSSLTATVGAELCPNRRLSVVAAAGGWSSLSGALICVAEWWSAHSHKKISESDKAHSPWQPLSPAMGIEDGVEALRSLEAVSLARAVAGAYASAVEQSEFIRSTRAPTTAPTGQASAHPLEKTLRAAGERITIAPNLELTPRFDKGLPSQSAASSAAIAASLPRRFATAVSAMSSMPCVQPELVRVLRAVVDRLPPTPFVSAMSRRRLRRNQSGDELATSTNQGPGVHQSSMETSHQCERAKRDMAPPLPRETMGKKRRIVSTSISANSTNSAVDTGGLRAAASGSAGEDGSERNAVENAGRKQPPTAERSDANGLQHYRHQERVTTMTDSRSGSERAAPREWPPVFSVQPGLQEALDVVVLSRARAGLEFFEALDGAGDAVADRGGDGGDGNCNSGNDMDCGGIISGEAVDSERLRSSTRRLSMLLQHTAAITCGLRVLAPLTEAGRFSALPHGDGARGRRLDFGVGGGRKRTTLEMAALDVRLDQQDGAGNLEPSVLETDHTNVSRIVCGLAGGFATAVRAVARYKPGSSIPSRDSRTKVVREDGNSSSLSAATSRAVALLWDMLLNCAAELPIGLHAALAQSGVDESSRSDTAEQLSARILLVNTVGDVAEKSLEVVLDSNSAVLDAALALEAQNTIAHSRGGTDPMGSRGSSLWVPRLVAPRDGGGNDEEGVLRGSGVGATTTVLGPMATSAAPLPLKCFLLAAAVANGWGREQDRGEGGLSTVDKEDGGRRNPRSRDSQAGRGKEEGEYSIEAVARRNPQDVDSSGEKLSGDEGGVNVGRRFAAAEAFLAGLRCGRRTIVAQSAVAALPCLSLCTCRRGRDVDSPSEHAGSCDWPTKWLPALLTLLEGTDGHGGGVSESVRLELAASLPRLGESLLQSQTDFSTAADANVASDAADDISASLQPRRKQALETRGDPGSVVSGDEAKASPNGFEDLLPLWPRLLQDESPVVRGVSARAALSAASAAPLPRLMSSGTAGARVLELLVGMLACGDPEVAWVVSGGAGQFVADGGKLLRALYGPSSTSSSLGVGVPTEASGSGAEEGRGGENDDGDEDTLGEEEEEERREERLREKALSRFIEAVGAKLQEHGDRLRRDRWQSLNEFTALLRALASIGCESDPTDNLGRSVYLWTLIRLVDVWVDEGNDCGPAAHEQIVRVCGHGKVPLTRLFRLPPPPSSTSSAGNSRGRGAGTRKAETDDELKAAVAFGEGLDSGGVLAPLMEKLMETGHVEEFVEQALGSPNFRAFLADSVARVLPIFVAGSKAVAVEKLAALCDRFEVGDARGKDPPQRLLNRHLPHVLTDVLMRGRSAWTDEKSSPGLQFLLKYFPESTPKRLIEGVLPQILEQVSWQLCGPRREEATVALQAVAHISYRHHDNAGAAAAAAAAANDVVSMDRKVEAMVTRHFLFLMSNVVSKRWSSRTTKDKIRAIQVLGRLVGFLSEDEGGGLFPKVMATLQSALADPHGTPAQRRAAYRVMMGYILGLSDASLAENLSTIVVNVLALIEEVGSDDGAEEITISGGGGGDGSRQILNNNSLLYVTSPPPKNSNTLPVAAAAAGARDGNVSHSLLLERAAAYSREGTGAPSPGVSSLSRRSDKGMEGLGSEAAEIRATAAALLRRLVVDKQDCLRGHFHKIPFMPQIPDLPALAEIGAVLSAELGYQSLREQLGRLTPLLGDESAEVRRAALKHLALVLRRDKQGLAELILEGREVDSVVSRLLRGLLELSTDSDARIRDVCGLCLGEVGAVDPSRVGLRLRDGATSDGGVPGGSGQALLDAAPWEVTVEEMSLLLIKNFLVPAFRASTTSMEQDRVAFGIQELLHILSVSFVKNAGDEDAASGLTQNLGNEHGDGRVPSGVGGGGGSVGPMPERLARRLREAQVLAVVEPFWRSTYKLSDRAPSSREAFFCDRAMTVSLERWLSSWCRYLISRARGPLRPAFEACRGAVRAHAPMAQYLLNHLVADVLAFGDREAVDQVLAEVLAVMRVASPASSSSSSFASTAEFQLARAAVPRAGGEGSFSSSRPKQRGRGGQNGSSRSSSSNSGIEHIATQAAFRLLDRLGHWSAGRGRRHGGAGVAGGVGWPDDATRRAALLDFVRRVPRGALVRASMRVRAYTRALRYLEEQIRAEHAARRSANGRSGANLLAQVGAFRNDGANGTLPVLNPAELHQLQAIYRTLSDEPDGMVGLEVMRGAAGVPATLKQRTWQHEHAEDWTGALEVYEQALQERELLNVRGRYLEGRDGVVPSPAAAAAADGVLRDRTDPMQDRYDQMAALPPPAAGSKADSPAQYHHRQQPSTKGVGDEGEEVKEDFEGDEWEEGEVERGMLHGLVELGHLEMLLHQASGMLGVASKQHLAPLLLPVAVEAAWRLQRWPLLQDLLHQQNSIGTEEHNLISQGGRGLSGVRSPSPSFAADELSGESRYRLALGKVMLRLEQAQPAPFASAVAEARADVMAGLGAASMESYQRAYPFLLKLHSIREAEQAFEVMQQRGRDPAAREKGLLDLGWDARLSAMAASLRQLAPVLAVRRAAFELCSLEGPQADNWLCLAKRARAAGQFAVAGAALRRAGRLGVCQERLAFEEAKLARERDGVHRALVMLEPVETDVDSLRALISLDPASTRRSSKRSGNASPGKILEEDERMQLARKLLLTTEWIVEAGQKHGEAVVARYKLALQLRPGWEKGYFCLGQYIDLLFKSRVEELQRHKQKGGGSSRQQRGARSRGWEGDELAHRLALQTMDNYARSLRYGAKYIFQSMPRLLTLWFQVGFLRDSGAGEGQSSVSSRSLRNSNGKGRRRHHQAAQIPAKSAIRKLQEGSTKLVKNAVRSIPPYMWYTALPQLTSRVGHPNVEVLKVIIEALAMLLKAHPKQAMWHLSTLCMSISAARKQVGNEVFEQARRMLVGDGRAEDAVAVQDGQKLFAELRNLAEEQPPKNLKEASFKIGHRMDLHRFIVPVQAGLTVSLPQAPRKDTWCGAGGIPSGRAKEVDSDVPMSQAEALAAASVAAHNPFPGAEMHIKCFNNRVRYMASKAKPKRVSLRTLETGETVYFLCKQERNGDLRKDARLMEFNGMINRLLQKDPAGRARKLRLRTYAVICLNEECGVLEWVQDTCGFRQLVHAANQIKNRGSSPTKPPSLGQIKTILDRVQMVASQENGLQRAVQMYREHILPNQEPCFHLWFVDHFAEPTAWFEARTTFARSAGVWSSVGHVVGLGDRHGENLLIHTESGECVHVDFDCLFDKGLTLARPEIVPFRLTPSMVDGMGLCGFEGVYRRAMEACISVLRTNRETLLSVLEPFLQDPTVGWSRSGRAQRSTHGNGEDLSDDGDEGRDDLGREIENEDADRVLRVISERLQGRYNLAVPRAGGRGVTDVGNDLPLSVQGQVHRLITEASSHENLCQMYVGWMPWM